MIDAETLRALRRLIEERQGDQRGRKFPLAALVGLAGLDERLRVTVDFDASEELGGPVIVLAPRRRKLRGLSKREEEVAALLARGLSNKEIAEKLFISVATVKDHVHRILEKTGFPNRTAVASFLSA
jgi:DNA-binding NarL/FixJ family response regulator